jgi:spermidine synthase
MKTPAGPRLPEGTPLPAGRFYFTTKYKTDKFESGLMHEYVSLLQALRFRAIRLLEIGIGEGGSLRYFEDYFENPDSVFVGLDQHLPLNAVEFKTNTHALIGDQNNEARLREIGEQFGPFDVIIDDGAHTRKETETTFNALFRYLAPGGYYFIEDWAAEFLGARYAGMVDLMLAIVKANAGITSKEVTLKMGTGFSYLLLRKTG